MENIIWVGDWNARIGHEQGRVDFEENELKQEYYNLRFTEESHLNAKGKK